MASAPSEFGSEGSRFRFEMCRNSTLVDPTVGSLNFVASKSVGKQHVTLMATMSHLMGSPDRTRARILFSPNLGLGWANFIETSRLFRRIHLPGV